MPAGTIYHISLYTDSISPTVKILWEYEEFVSSNSLFFLNLS